MEKKKLVCIFAVCVGIILGGVTGNSSLGVAEAQTITLKVWDEFTHPTATKAFDDLIAQFESSNPNVKIERTTMSMWDSKDVIKPAIAAGGGPDILYHNAGPAYLGILFKGGLAMDLTEAYKEKGWEKDFDPGARFVTLLCKYKGKTYGIPFGIENPLIFYNKDKMSRMGMTEPGSYEEFLNACEKTKAEGESSLIWGNKDGWPGAQIMDWMFEIYAGKERLDEVWFGSGKWTDSSFVQAAAELLRLYEKGYFVGEPNGISYDDANMMFYTGEGLFYYTGWWLAAEIIENSQFNVGLVEPPSPSGRHLIAPNRAWIVSSITKHPETCVDFLDFILSPSATKIWIEEGGYWPPMYINRKYDIPSWKRKIQEIVSTPPFGYFCLDVYLPSNVVEYHFMSTQQLIDKVVTPEEMMENYQKEWERTKAEGIMRLEP